MRIRVIAVAVMTMSAMLLAMGGATAPESAPLKAFVDALQKAEGLKATYTLQNLGAAAERFSVDLSKPNLARIEKPGMTIVADGSKITFYDKNEKQYYTRNQTPAELNALFAGDELRVWSGFFDAKAFDKISAKSEPSVTRKGMEMDVVKATLDSSNGKVVTLYISKSDGVARQATMDYMEKGQKVTRLLDTLSLSLAKPKNNDVYAFAPPAGSKEVKEEDLIKVVWLTDLDEAAKAAQKAHKRIMVHFTADWCTWCRKLEQEVYSTAEFKKMGQYFVFCQIDIDKNKDLASEFQVSGIPDVRFLESDGTTEVHKIVGYEPKDKFLADMEKAVPSK